MAKCTLTIEDSVDAEGQPIVTMEGDFGNADDKMSHAVAMTMAIHRLFTTHWLGKNVAKIVPEFFIQPEKDENTDGK